MGLKKINQWEKAVVMLLNFDGWELEWTGEGSSRFDAEGFTPEGNFMYWLNTLKMPDTIKKYCPDTTMWTKKRILKDVYLLKENDAVRINLNTFKK